MRRRATAHQQDIEEAEESGSSARPEAECVNVLTFRMGKRVRSVAYKA